MEQGHLFVSLSIKRIKKYSCVPLLKGGVYMPSIISISPMFIVMVVALLVALRLFAVMTGSFFSAVGVAGIITSLSPEYAIFLMPLCILAGLFMGKALITNFFAVHFCLMAIGILFLFLNIDNFSTFHASSFSTNDWFFFPFQDLIDSFGNTLDLLL